MFIRILVFLCITSFGMAQSEERESLRGLKGVQVLIEDLHSEAKLGSLTKSQLQTEAELRLRRSGIPVLESSDSYLYVNVNAVSSSSTNWYSVSVDISLRQSVYLERDPTITAHSVATWEQGSTLIVDRNQLREFVRETVGGFVDKFANDYLTVNPRFQSVREEIEIAGKTFWLGMTKEEVLENIPKGHVGKTQEIDDSHTRAVRNLFGKNMSINNMATDSTPNMTFDYEVNGTLTFDSEVFGLKGSDAKVVSLSSDSKDFKGPNVNEFHKALHEALVWAKDGKEFDIVKSEVYSEDSYPAMGDIDISIGKRRVTIWSFDGGLAISKVLFNE